MGRRDGSGERRAVPSHASAPLPLVRGLHDGRTNVMVREAGPLPLNPYQQYRATRVETAGSVDLIVMLYQGAVRFIRLGLDALEQRDLKTTHKHLVRAQEIVVELQGSLNYEAGGEIAT